MRWLMAQITVLRIISLILGLLTAFASFYLNIPTKIFLLICGILSLIGTISAFAVSHNIYRKLDGSKEDSFLIKRDGLRYWTWFVGHNLAWVSLGFLSTYFVVELMGSWFGALALTAGFIALTVHALIGVLWRIPLPQLHLCWLTLDSPLPASPQADAALLSTHYEQALRLDATQGRAIDVRDTMGFGGVSKKEGEAGKRSKPFHRLEKQPIQSYVVPEIKKRLNALLPSFTLAAIIGLLFFFLARGVMVVPNYAFTGQLGDLRLITPAPIDVALAVTATPVPMVSITSTETSTTIPAASPPISAEATGESQQQEGEQSSDDQSGSEQSGGEPASSEQSNGEQSGSEQSGSEPSSGEQSSSEQSNGEQSGGEPSSGEQSNSEQSNGEQSGSEQSGSEPSSGEQSNGEQSGSEPSSGEQSNGEQSGSEQSNGEQSGSEQSGSEQSNGEQSNGEQSGSEQSGGEPSSGEQSNSEQSGSEPSSGEQSNGEQSGGEPSSGEQSSSEQSDSEPSSGEQSNGEQSGSEPSSGEQSSSNPSAESSESGSGAGSSNNQDTDTSNTDGANGAQAVSSPSANQTPNTNSLDGEPLTQLTPNTTSVPANLVTPPAPQTSEIREGDNEENDGEGNGGAASFNASETEFQTEFTDTDEPVLNIPGLENTGELPLAPINPDSRIDIEMPPVAGASYLPVAQDEPSESTGETPAGVTVTGIPGENILDPGENEPVQFIPNWILSLINQD